MGRLLGCLPCLILTLIFYFGAEPVVRGQKPDSKIVIEEIKGAELRRFTPIPNQIVVRLSASRDVSRIGILVTPIDKLRANADVVDWSGNWQRIHKGEPQLWVPAKTYVETPPITVAGRPGPQTYLVQAVAELSPGAGAGGGNQLIYTEPRVVRMTLVDGVAPPANQSSGDGKAVPTERRVAGEWQALRLYPDQQLRDAVAIGNSLYAILDGKLLVEIDLATLRQRRSLEMPQRVARMARADKFLVLLLDSPNQIVAVDPGSLVVKWKYALPTGQPAAFAVAAQSPIACISFPDPERMLRVDFGTGAFQEWAGSDLVPSSAGASNEGMVSSDSLALSPDGSSYFIFANKALHRIRFAGEKLEVMDTSPHFKGVVRRPTVRSLGGQGIIAVNASVRSITEFLRIRGVGAEGLLLYRSDDLSSPIASLPYWSPVFDVDDETGIVVASGEQGVTISLGTQLPVSKAGFAVQGDSLTKERGLVSRKAISPYAGEQQVLFLGRGDGRVLTVGARGTFLLRPPDWILANILEK